jgi:hypothetical protein
VVLGGIMGVVEFPKIKELQEELARLLEERPEFKPLQAEIDEALKKAGNNKINRNVVIQTMMMQKMKELQQKMLEMAESLQKKE